MDAVAVGVVILLTLMGTEAAANCNDSEVEPDQVYLPLPFPGDFLGVSTTPDCIGSTALICPITLSNVVIVDRRSGDNPGDTDPTEFMAWNESSRITLVRGGVGTINPVRQVNLYFYHEPASGIGLPEFTLSASTSEIQDLGSPLSYTILGNQDLTMDDAQVRNVTLALTEQITVSSNRFHIRFSLTDSIRQFAISEIQLCSDEATNEVESLTLELDSGPLSGPAIILPANQSEISSIAVNLTLTCTVANQGRFEWQWTPQDYSSLVSDDTRSSMIEIPLGVESVGEYTCIASYHPDTLLDRSPVMGNFTVQLERLLTTEENVKHLDNVNSGDLTLECVLAGYIDESIISIGLISWTFKGQPLTTDSTYTISVAQRDCPPYGTCALGGLRIRELSSDVLGEYVCSFDDLSQTITLLGEYASRIGPKETMTSPPPPPVTTTTESTSNMGPIVGGVVGAGVVVAIVIIAIVIVVIVICSRRVPKSAAFSSKNRDSYGDDPDALYTVIPKNDPPPPLPSRPIPGTYASIDSKDNGHIQLVTMISPTRDSIISMPAEIGGTNADHLLAKLSNAGNKVFPLRNNPLYSSADNLLQGAPPLPEKSFSSIPNDLHDSNLNIYAVPHKPPTLPERMASPDVGKELSPPPIYSESLTPAEFHNSSAVGSPESSGSKICPCTSIYADPKPLMKEEGPVEVRPYHVREIRPLGTGQFGEVILAETLSLSMKDLKLSESTNKSVNIQVAVKRLKHDADKVVKEAFEKEIKFMSRLNHMNVIRLLAICPTGHPFILMEYMECGDLNQYLQKYEIAPRDTEPADNQIQVASLLYACVQVANGMRYLASLHFIHRDLATRNCLVGKENTIKIADFGMSRSLYSSHYYRIQGRAILPIRWMANECFYGRFSEKTDVWAFGVTMWEVFTLAKQQPYDSLSDQEVIENAVELEKMKHLPKPEHCPEEVYEVMLQCWEKDPETRINFEDVYSSLSALHSYSDI